MEEEVKTVTERVTVTVQIQMDIKIGGNALSQVQDILEVVNDIISNNEVDDSPSILLSGIDNSEIFKDEE